MPSEPVQRVLDALGDRVQSGRGRNGHWQARCPAHDDRNPSLSIAEGEDGRALVHCHRPDCSTESVVAALDLTMRDLFERRNGSSAPVYERRLAATYDYVNEQGALLFQVCRFEIDDGRQPKAFKQRQPNGSGGWTWNVAGVRRVLYRLPEVLAAVVAGEMVYVTEGEKDVESLERLGLTATTNPAGAGKWRDEYSEQLRGARVVILPDNDVPGRSHAQDVARSLHGVAAEIRVLELPGLPAKGDVFDWLALGGTRGQLEQLVTATSRWEPPDESLDLERQPVSTVPRTELQLARLFAAECRDEARYVPGVGWHVWDGRRWARDETGAAERLMKALVDSLIDRARAEEDDERKAALKRAISFQSRSRIANALALAQTELPLVARVRDLDADEWLLATLSGTVDLRTGELREHRREDLITKLAPVEYDPDAGCTRWQEFLAQILPGGGELIDYVQRFVGYSISGSTREQVMAVCYGLGANGKSTLLETLRELLGDYAVTADFSTFAAKREQGGATPEVVRLRGARFVASIETGAGRGFNEVMIKQLTGGDTVAARELYARAVEFRPSFKLWVGANHRPQVQGTDWAIWRRIHLIPFTVTIPPDERDPELRQKLVSEGPGILAWAVRGCLEWQRRGLLPPEAVRAATEEYRDEQDVISGFLAEHTEQRGEVKSAELYSEYLRWVESSGEEKLSRTKFGLRLTERGLGSRKTGGLNWWIGIRLRRGGSVARFSRHRRT